jgi:SAM-dependent methyltransferase
MADVSRQHIGERVLEIGAGVGNLTLNLVPRTVYWATDINPMYLSELRKLEETRPYLHTARVDLTSKEPLHGEEKFVTVICLNVVEHVEDDLSALRNLRSLLVDGGRAIVLVPQGPALFGTLDTVLGHRRRYRREQLESVARTAGFHVKEILDFNRASVPAWWFNGRVLRRKHFGLGQMKMLNLLVPIFRKADRWLPTPSLSLIAILERSAEPLANSVSDIRGEIGVAAVYE